MRHLGIGRQELCDAEVGEYGVAGFIEQNVLGLHITMHDVALMRVGQRGGDLSSPGQRLIGGQGSAVLERGLEVRSLHVAHDHVVEAVVLAEVVDVDDVGVIKLRDRARLTLKPCPEVLRVCELRPDELDGTEYVQLCVVGFVDLSHAASAKRLNDLVVADAGADEVHSRVRGPMDW